jgi:hypothetical protein
MYDKYACVAPLGALLVGIVIIWRWPNSHVLIEVIVSTLWVLALVWAGYILIFWQLMNIPLFYGLRSHYYLY